jgi:hypothetical protein
MRMCRTISFFHSVVQPDCVHMLLYLFMMHEFGHSLIKLNFGLGEFSFHYVTV